MNHRHVDPLERNILLLAGWTLVLAGAVTFPLPIPIGLFLLTVGFAILIPNSRTLRRGVVFLKNKWPGFRSIYYSIRSRLPSSLQRKLDEEDNE
jgi:hypothetical protein